MRREAARLGYIIIDQRNMQEAVANDITNALKLFATLFGDSPYRHFYVTEIPYGEGVSFPGMIDLSFSTFLTTSLDGFDAFFRAHETAHQWFGNGVRSATYRDAWLSEGLASYCGLLYLRRAPPERRVLPGSSTSTAPTSPTSATSRGRSPSGSATARSTRRTATT